MVSHFSQNDEEQHAPEALSMKRAAHYDQEGSEHDSNLIRSDSRNILFMPTYLHQTYLGTLLGELSQATRTWEYCYPASILKPVD